MKSKKVRISKNLSLSVPDFIRGAALAAFSSVSTLIYEVVSKDGFKGIDWGAIGGVGFLAALGYLIKNYAVEPPKVITVVPTNEEAVKAKIDINKAI